MINAIKKLGNLVSARVALAVAVIRAALLRKSVAINQVVIIVIILAVGIAAVLLYKGFADGIIQKVFTNVGKVVDDLFKTS